MNKSRNLLVLLESENITKLVYTDTSDQDVDYLRDASMIDELLRHIGVESLDDALLIYDINDKEEIWSAEPFFTMEKEWDEENSDGLGIVEMGHITINGKKIPTFYTQNAHPIAFFVNNKYKSELDKLL